MTQPSPAALALLARPTWSDVARGALAQWLIFVPLLSVLLFLAWLPDGPGASLAALLSPLYSAAVGAVVTFCIGVPLAKLLARLLAKTTVWRVHLAAFLGLGFILAALIIHLWMFATGSLWDSTAWWGSMSTFLPIASAAALSVGAGWGIAWRHAVVAERVLPLVAQ
ncbi:MAG: hypothetical protein KF761_09990 [Salinibacterium sp.]|nr:hypothetical protein [Salinibacterium sp.]